MDRLHQFYDVRHEALSKTRFIQSVSEATLLSYAQSAAQPITFRIIMFTRNRLASFKRACESVRNALPIESRVVVDIRVDYDADMSEQERRQYKNDLDLVVRDQGSASDINVHWSSTTVGLRAAILSSWSPASNDEYVIFIVSASHLVPAIRSV